MATVIDKGFDDAEIINESPRSPHIFKDINLFFTRNPATNDITKVTDIQDIKRSVYNLCRTEFGERLFHPEIGAGIRPLLFENFGPMVYTELQERIRNLLTIYEPRVEVENIVIHDPGFMNQDNNTLSIKLYFIVKNIPTQVEEVDVTLQRVR